ncbi:glycosyltransferase family 4 protein [Marinigracilibium pacificum]|uniref:Glycosyltransferase family 4 protein n=1 Tax=Marinigracilibium pacificum TaxID=2729599 RepID=A0A848ITI9_9BACT|nr:glycosyltransferase family 4 protein [Marinigracilibium pacificum]NMM47076.1 glycosyltransferase family 4 protein [Marinigracilibium pacificum]
MKILYLHQYFKTPSEGGATRSYYLSQAMKNAGHDVTIITSHNSTRKEEKNVDGINVIYLPVRYDNSFGYLRRVLSFITFSRSVYRFFKSMKNQEFDLCYATSTPLTIGWSAIQIKDKFQIPFIFEVRDLWPEAPIQLGVIKNPFLKMGLRAFEKYVYEQALQIIALSPDMVAEIRKIVPWKDIKMIPNFSDPDFFEGKVRPLFTKDNKVVISYFGAAGYVNGLNSLLNCAVAIQHDNRFEFRVMAEGAYLEKLKKEVRKNRLANVKFLPYGNKSQVISLLQDSSFSYISFLPKKVLGTNSPNKFFDSLAAGVPVIVNTKGWTQDIVVEYHCGFYHDFNESQSFTKALLAYVDNPATYAYASENALFLAKNHFQKDRVIQKLIDDLSTIENQKPGNEGIMKRA